MISNVLFPGIPTVVPYITISSVAILLAMFLIYTIRRSAVLGALKKASFDPPKYYNSTNINELTASKTAE